MILNKMFHVLAVFGCLSTLVCYRQWFQHQYYRVKTIIGLTGAIQAPTSSTIDISRHSSHLRIKYPNFGSNYTLNVPYNPTFVAKMLNLHVTLVSDNEVTDITQQPGIPYMLSAEELGGNIISVVDEDTGTSETYSSTVKPMYCQEVLCK
jgi:hypothetical protein